MQGLLVEAHGTKYMDKQAASSAQQQNPDELVTLTNKKTNEVRQVRRADLPSYGLPIDYHSQADIYANAVKNGQQEITSVPEAYRGGATAALSATGYKQKTQKEKDAEVAKSDTLNKAKAVLKVIDQGEKGQLTGQDYTDALNYAASAYTASKAFSEGGKNLTGTELGVLTGQIPRIEKHTGNALERAINWFEGREVPQTGAVIDSPDQLKNKMTMVVNTLDTNAKLPYGTSKNKTQQKDVPQRLAEGAVKNINQLGQGIVDEVKQNTKRMTPKLLGGQGEGPTQAAAETALDVGKGLANQAVEMAPINDKGQFDTGKTANYVVDNPVNTAMLFAPLKGAKLGKLGAAEEGAAGADAAASTGTAANAMPNVVQQVVRGATDLVRGGGSKEFVARTAKNSEAIPQNQVLLEENILSHPTETGKIQATSKALGKFGGQLGDVYAGSDKVFKGTEFSDSLTTKLKGMGYDSKAINFIKNYIYQQGSLDLESGNNLITMEKAWQTAQKLEKNPPKMLKNPESAASYKQLSLDAARAIREGLASKLPETKPINARYSALRDYLDNGLKDPQGMNPSGSILNTAANAGQAVTTPVLQGLYKASSMMPNIGR